MHSLFKVLILSAVVILLASCGGGGSSSGGDSNTEVTGTEKDVTAQCIREEPSKVTDYSDFVNKCNIDVNFVSLQDLVGFIGEVKTLKSGGRSLKIFDDQTPIACRPPSVPVAAGNSAVCN